MLKRVESKNISIIVCLLTVAYFLTNLTAFGLGGHISYFSHLVIRLIIWLLIGGLVIYYPRGRGEGLVRLRSSIKRFPSSSVLPHIIYTLIGVFTNWANPI